MEDEKLVTWWAPLLHVYQPPTQEPAVLRRIAEECYAPLFDVVATAPKCKVTFNVNGVLLDLLVAHGLDSVVDSLRECVDAGRVELVGTAKYHPLLPLLPVEEARRQVKLQEESLRTHLGLRDRPKGFFPPEMAVDQATFSTAAELGYQWVAASGVACSGDWPYDHFQRVGAGPVVVYRDDVLSNEVSFRCVDAAGFVGKLAGLYDAPAYVVTAQDGETFGHHVPKYEREFLARAVELVAQTPGVRMAFVSELLELFPERRPGRPVPSSWSTTFEDLRDGVPYPLWKHPDNPVHRLQYKLLKALNGLVLLLGKVEGSPETNGGVAEYARTARYFYDLGVHSCQFWWASMRPSWSPNLILKGAELLLRAALNANLALLKAGVVDGDDYFDQVVHAHDLLLREVVDQTAARERVRLIK
ncbi:MAG: hypothetical protein Kow0069_35600 [Promethearchaeota archaeon]